MDPLSDLRSCSALNLLTFLGISYRVCRDHHRNPIARRWHSWTARVELQKATIGSCAVILLLWFSCWAMADWSPVGATMDSLGLLWTLLDSHYSSVTTRLAAGRGVNITFTRERVTTPLGSIDGVGGSTEIDHCCTTVWFWDANRELPSSSGLPHMWCVGFEGSTLVVAGHCRSKLSWVWTPTPTCLWV